MEKPRLDLIAKFFAYQGAWAPALRMGDRGAMARIVVAMLRLWAWGLIGAVAPLSAPAAAEDVVYANKCAAGFYLSYSRDVSGDCFAWRQFIALNWPVDGHRHGESGDRSFVQWQTFPSEADVLGTDGAAPARGQRAPLPRACAARVEAAKFRPEQLILFQAPAGPARKRLRINSSSQAGVSDNQASWVGASNNTNLWYEIRISPKEADFIVANRLYSVDGQAGFIAAGHPLVLPESNEDGPAGAIELKAAWMEVPDPENPKWTFFKAGAAPFSTPPTMIAV